MGHTTKLHSTLAFWLVAYLCCSFSDVRGQAPQSESTLSTTRGEIVMERDVEYGKAGETSLKLDVIRPRDAGKTPRPAIVYVHGGAWCMGDKAEGINKLKPLVESGDYVGFTVNYRLSTVAPWPAQTHDCKAAIRWIRANAQQYHVDPKRIGVYGNSAGGHLVCMLGVSGDREELEGDNGTPGVSSRVICVVNKWGPTDLLTAGFEDPQDWQIIGGTPEERPDLAKSASPLYYVNRHCPPFLHFYGTNDPIVHYNSQAVPFHKSLRKAGVDSTLATMVGAGHGISHSAIDERVFAFFAKHLLGKDVEVSAEPIRIRTTR